MKSSAELFNRHIVQSLVQDCRGVVGALAIALLLSACAGTALDRDSIAALAPLKLGDNTLTVADATARLPRPDLLALDESMREFVEYYTRGQNNSRVRLLSLHQAIRGSGGLNMEYDPFAEGTAQEVFHRGTANCLSYANMFIALAREAGLEANYQWLEVRPQWCKVSERVQVGLHVNVVVRLRDGKRFMVDIEPPPSRDIAGSQELTDSDAQALYYNNIAMSALASENLEEAWTYLVSALQLSPEMAHLWVNLGAIYRYSGQHQQAESSYLQALELDFTEYSAMTNLAVLYAIQGREEERSFWLDKVERHRQSNPYYHAWRGDEAAAEKDWSAALGHYSRAVELLPRDSNLLFSRGLIHYQLNNYDAAATDIEFAIELATLYSDIAYYQLQLDEVHRARLAGT